jgi:hypothetical protein
LTFVDELLHAWASDDWQHIRSMMGYPSTSPSFKQLADCDEPEPFELSASDVLAVQAAVQWLADSHPQEYQAICRRHKRQQFGDPLPGDASLVDMASSRLSKRLKEMLE